MIIALLLAAIVGPLQVAAGVPMPLDADVSVSTSRAAPAHSADAPNVSVWISGDNQFRRGDRVRVHFRADEDAYVTIVRVDTDGRLRILFPASPYEDGRVRAGESYRAWGHDGDGFIVNDARGLGYVFAIASFEPFDFDRVSYRRGWDYDYIDRQMGGDPFVAVQRFGERIVWDDRTPYSTEYAEYYVERQAQYASRGCYDCYDPYPWWDRYDPYHPWITVVIGHHHRYPYYYSPYYYDSYDPYYYGRRVVYTRRPRYEFKPVGRSGTTVVSRPIARRPRDEGGDRRRPGSSSTDPNTGGGRRVASGDAGPGATRPGDDVPRGTTAGGHRREADRVTPGGGDRGGQPVRGHAPRRDPVRNDDGGSDHGGGPGDHGGGQGDHDSGQRDHVSGAPDERGPRTPRRDADGESSSSSRDDSQGERRSESRSEPRTESRSEPRTESRSEPRTESRSEPRTESRSEPRTESRGEPRTESRGEPRTESRGERRSEPGGEPRRASEARSDRGGERRASPKSTSSSGRRETRRP